MKIKDLSDDDFNSIYETLIQINNNEPLPYYTHNIDRHYTKDEVRNDYELLIAFFSKVITSDNENISFKVVDKLPSDYYISIIYTLKTKDKEYSVFKKLWRNDIIDNNSHWEWNDEIIINPF